MKRTMRPLKELVPFEDALRLCLDVARPVERTEAVSLRAATGRVAAADVASPIDVPAADRAAMDGYAVRARDTFGASKAAPKPMHVLEALYASSVPRRRMTKGNCSEVATGALLPPGADAVVMVEVTERTRAGVLVREPVHPMQNVSRRGEDVGRGDTVVAAGELLAPAKVGVLAAVGENRVRVFARPRVAVLPTGDEVVPPGRALRPGRVYDINSYTLASVVEQHGGEPMVQPGVGDRLPSLRRAVEACLGCDLVVFSGGSSVGARDMIMDVLQEMGELLFHGIAVKPGKPTVLGRVRGKPVLGMPGYPTSCLSNAYMLLAPMLRRMAHLPPSVERTVRVPLAQRIVSAIGRVEFYTVRLVNGAAVPAFKESGAITSMALADGYLRIPANVDLLEKGDRVDVTLF